MKIIDLFEAIGGSAPLYHATNLESIVNILSKNQLAADTSHAMMYINPVLRGKPEGNKKLAGVSLTRSKAFAEDWADIILVLDQEKIRHNKKLIPINYFNDEPDGTYSAQDREEFEEFVVGSISPLDKFISGIYFPARLENDYTNYKWVSKNIKPYPDEYKGWLAVVNSPKYVGKPIRNVVEKKAVNEDVDVDQYLYHATYKPYLKKIKEFGLGGGKIKRNWSDSKAGVVYLATSPDVAESYAETADNVPDSYLDNIVILKIDKSKLDLDKLIVDANVQDNTGETLEYHGIIPSTALSLLKGE